MTPSDSLPTGSAGTGDFVPPDPATHSDHVEDPPKTILGIVSHLGPGLIIAAAIVGSGELVATTSTGAVAGFSLLWLIIIGCMIKVYTQIEFGRFSIVTGRTTMQGLNEVPGPRFGPANWLVWYWLVMFIFSLGQLGGIIGGVGQATAMVAPIYGDFNQLLAKQEEWDENADRIRAGSPNSPNIEANVTSVLGQRPQDPTYDEKIWAVLITLVTIAMLVRGRYSLVQNVSMILVAGFTLVTFINLFALQAQPEFAISASDLWRGLTFQLAPQSNPTSNSPLIVALMTLGIIGVGATELIQYPYWCLEKGYARQAGRRDDSPEWAYRARGWLRVLKWDAWVSMVIYTFATCAFYLLGATVLYRQGLVPENNEMIYVLGLMYENTFGSWAQIVFLTGAFAVLYSTFFVSIASHARVVADAVRVYDLGAHTEKTRLWWVRTFCILFPTISLAFFLVYPDPKTLIFASALMQALMLPMLAGAALYFRYWRCDSRLTPRWSWDVMLWLSFLVMLICGISLAGLQIYRKVGPFILDLLGLSGG